MPCVSQSRSSTSNVSFQDITFNNFALISHKANDTNIDHIWHDDSSNTWHLVSDASYKSTGNTNLRVGTVNTGQGNNKLYAMNQHVRTTDTVSFAGATVNGKVSMHYARFSTNNELTWWQIRRDTSNGDLVISDDGIGDVFTIRQNNGNVLINNTARS